MPLSMADLHPSSMTLAKALQKITVPQTSLRDNHSSASDNNASKLGNWRPLFLRRHVLLALFFLLLSQISGLVALYVYSEKKEGIVPVAAKYHYLWKYGPSAVLTVTVALWIQVEYRAKQVTSWQVLAADSDKGDLAVSRESLKIDYFSKINLVVVVSSTKQRHWAVAMSTTGTLMLQLAVVISTSLLERESRRLEYSTSSLPAAATFTRSVEIDDDRIPLNELGIIDSATYRGFGVLGEDQQLLPPGTTTSLAYRPLRLPVPVNAAEEFQVAGSKSFVTAEVDYLAPSTRCSPVMDRWSFLYPLEAGLRVLQLGAADNNATLTIRAGEQIQPGFWQMDCTLVIRANQTDIAKSFPVYISDRDSCLPPLCAQELPTGCVKTLQAKNYTGPGRANSSEVCNDHIFIYSLRPCKVGKEVNLTFTVMRCINDNRYGKARLRFENTAHGGSDPKTVSLQDHGSATNGPYGNGLFYTTTSLRSHGLWSCFRPASVPIADDKITDPAVLTEHLEKRYAALAVQLFRVGSFVEANNETVPGTVNAEVWRLTMHAFSCLATVTLLATVAFLCVGVIILTPAATLPTDPSTLAGAAVCLATTRRGQSFLQSQGQAKGITIDTNPKPWRPWGTTKLSAWLMVGAFACVVALLPATYMLSAARSEGLATVHLNSWAHYAWTILPGLIAAGLQLMIDSMAFNFRVLHPYAALARGGEKNSVDALFEDYVFGLLPGHLWTLARRRHLSLGAVVLGAMATRLSMIVAADLFTLSGDPSATGVTLLQADGFAGPGSPAYNWTTGTDAPWRPDQFDSVSNLLSPVELTVGDAYAVPRVQLPPQDVNAATQFPNGSITAWASVQTTVARGRLNCTFIDTQCSETTYLVPASVWPDQGAFNLSCSRRRVTIPESFYIREGCSATTTLKNISAFAWADEALCWCNAEAAPLCQELTLYSYPSEAAASWQRFKDYSTQQKISVVSNNISLVGRFWPRTLLPPQNDQHAARLALSRGDCPVFMTYGQEVVGDCTASRSSFAVCDPYLELGAANVTYTLPGLRAGSVSKNEAVLSPGTQHQHVYGMSRYLQQWAKAAFEHSDDPLDGVAAFSPYVPQDEIFRSITASGISGDGISLEHLRALDPGSRAKVVARLDALWARNIARIARNNLTTTQGYDPPKRLEAVVTDYRTRRLIQNNGSTWILQGLLAAALVCFTVGFLSGGGRGDMGDALLPFPPTSVEAILALLRGSRIVELVTGEPIDASPPKDKDRKTGREIRHSEKGTMMCLTTRRLDINDTKDMRTVFEVPGRVYSLTKREASASSGPQDANKAGAQGSFKRWTYRIDFEDAPSA